MFESFYAAYALIGCSRSRAYQKRKDLVQIGMFFMKKVLKKIDKNQILKTIKDKALGLDYWPKSFLIQAQT